MNKLFFAAMTFAVLGLAAGANVAIAAQKTAPQLQVLRMLHRRGYGRKLPCSYSYQRRAESKNGNNLNWDCFTDDGYGRRLDLLQHQAPLNPERLSGPPPPRRRTAAGQKSQAARPNASPRWAEIHLCSAEPLQSSLRRFQCRIRDTLGEMRRVAGRGCATQLREGQAPPPEAPPTTGRAKRHRPHRTSRNVRDRQAKFTGPCHGIAVDRRGAPGNISEEFLPHRREADERIAAVKRWT